MTPDQLYILSFYQDISFLNREHDVRLVRHIKTGQVFVRKTLTHFERPVYQALISGTYRGIPRIYGFIDDGDSCVIIEEFINGSTVEERLKQTLFSEEETIRITSELCSILEPLHSSNPAIIHRDIKASNLMLSQAGTLYLLDFDAAKQYHHGKNRDTVLIGTEDYAAPEQYGFAQSSAQTDIYAIGVLINKMLTGKLPFEQMYSGPLAAIISKCTQLDPNARYQNVSELTSALSQNQTSPKPLPLYRNMTGFKSGKALPAIGVSVWYIVAALISFTGEIKDSEGNLLTGSAAFANRIAVFATLVMLTLYLGDSFGLRRRFPLKIDEQSSKSRRVLQIILGVFIILFIAGTLGVLIDSFLAS